MGQTAFRKQLTLGGYGPGLRRYIHEVLFSIFPPPQYIIESRPSRKSAFFQPSPVPAGQRTGGARAGFAMVWMVGGGYPCGQHESGSSLSRQIRLCLFSRSARKQTSNCFVPSRKTFCVQQSTMGPRMLPGIAGPTSLRKAAVIPPEASPLGRPLRRIDNSECDLHRFRCSRWRSGISPRGKIFEHRRARASFGRKRLNSLLDVESRLSRTPPPKAARFTQSRR